eukprot:TRINITY_DN2166_c0_g1_i22.p1 TRINITY_DN2166_c0_g1~~TRINITY_DN2166_c0_g1_i22.p1  ORF type:complete len:464 (+),score=145.30 TRINITY_DN2166_c0_g1_i22:619-2010(+)
MCGLVRFTTNSLASAPATTICASFDKGDRGWFRRVHDFCNEIDCKDHAKSMNDLLGYGGVMTFAIVCGIGWMLSGVVALVASMSPDKVVALVAAVLFTALYAVFIGIFATVWMHVRKVRKECPFYTDECKDYKKKTRKSSIEFLAYSICAFVLIFAAILCCFLAVFSIDFEDKEEQVEAPENDKEAVWPKSSDRAGGRPETHANKQEEEVALNRPNLSPTVTRQPEAVPMEPAPVEESKRYSGEEFKPKFAQLHKYIGDPIKMQEYANQKFDEVDADRSGAISAGELRVFVADIMRKKGFPEPTDQKIDELMKYFDKDNSSTLEKNEFEKMLREIFVESREILAQKYAAKKADSWKPAKVPKSQDRSQLQALDKELNRPVDFYKTLDEIASSKRISRDSTISFNEVKELVDGASGRFRVPALTKAELQEILEDIERPIRDFNKADQNLTVYTCLLYTSPSPRD